MKAQMDLKRDIFRKTIRREHINNVLSARRQQFISPSAPPTISCTSSLPTLLPLILQTYKQPFQISKHLLILNELCLLPTSTLSNPDLLKYLQKLTQKHFSNQQIISEEWEQLIEKIQTLMGRFLQSQQQLVIQNHHLLWSILDNLGGCWLWGMISEYQNQEVKRIGFRMFHKYVEGLDKGRIVHQGVGWIYSNFITKQPKPKFTDASCVVETFLKVADMLKEDDYYDYTLCLLEICREENQIEYLNELQVLPEITSFLSKTKDLDCICLSLKFISMMFRGSDSLSLKVFLNNPTIVSFLDAKLTSFTQQVSAWTIFALANFCANGQQFIKTIFQVDIIPQTLKLYQESSNKLRTEIVFLYYVICDKGGDKFRMRLYEENVLGVVVREVGEYHQGLENCLKIVYQMLLSAAKMDSLQMTYTQRMVRELVVVFNFKRRLEELITHPKESISNLALLILNTYLEESSLLF